MFSAAGSEDISQTALVEENSSDSTSNAQESTEDTTIAKVDNRETGLKHQFKMLLREAIICVILAVTTLGALNNTPTKIEKHPMPQRFFSKDSGVRDWYHGQLSKALTAAGQADVAFIMYYAPWDAECQYVRGEFEKAAKIMGDRVHFSAINCWQPGSLCKHHNKIHSWPVLSTNIVHSKPFVYKGPKEAHNMVKFLEMVMTPLKRLSTAEELVNLMSICDIVAVGYTPLLYTPKYYNIWNSVAIQAKGYDVVGEICFAVVTSHELAADLGVENLPSVKYMLWNETLDYGTKIDHLWNASHILPWILENFRQPVEWVIPRWYKSYNLERIANGNPTLILFTPLNPLYEQIPMYSLLREIAVEYYNCAGNPWLRELVKLKQIRRLLYQENNISKFCREFRKKLPKNPPKVKFEVLSQQNKYPWSNSSVKNVKSSVFGNLFKYGLVWSQSSGESQVVTPLNFVQECTSKVLSSGIYGRENYEQCNAFDDVIREKKLDKILETKMQPEDDDPLSADNLFQSHISHFCKLYNFAKLRNPPIFPGMVNFVNITHIHGLACKTNRTLNILAMDSVRDHHFAESLGIDVTNVKDKTAVVILDTKYETQYVLSEEISAKTIRDFINDFTENRLKRTMRSRVQNAKHSHSYTHNLNHDVNDIVITDLTSKSFRKFVNTPNTISIVCMCGGVCQARVNRAILSAARLLVACGVLTQVGRLDGTTHDMMWQYTAPTYPTILVFPADRTVTPESRVYPSNEQISSGGVVALVLHTLLPPQHLHVRLALCSFQEAINEKSICLKDLKQQVTTLIGKNLEKWRFHGKHIKHIIYKRLQMLHQISFHFGLLHVSDLHKHSKRQKIIIKLIDKLSSNWNSGLIQRLLVTVKKENL